MKASTMSLRTLEIKVTSPPLELYVTDEAFQPNATSVRFARAVVINPGDLVFDIGTGVGPLALKAAVEGASRVIGVDPVSIHCELARKNVEKYGLQNKVTIYQGEHFAPFKTQPELKDLKADVIIGDVSGIADAVARGLGWYSTSVPTGGYDGTQVILDFLSQAPHYLKPGGRLYFPIATDLSDGAKIIRAASEIFERVENALPKEFVIFPLDPKDVKAISDSYNGKVPPFINIQSPDKRPHWRGQIFLAANPR